MQHVLVCRIDSAALALMYCERADSIYRPRLWCPDNFHVCHACRCAHMTYSNPHGDVVMSTIVMLLDIITLIRYSNALTLLASLVPEGNPLIPRFGSPPKTPHLPDSTGGSQPPPTLAEKCIGSLARRLSEKLPVHPHSAEFVWSGTAILEVSSFAPNYLVVAWKLPPPPSNLADLQR